MTLNRIGSVLALLAVFCVLAVFLCHSMQGPYSVVHGPVTALLSVRASVGLRMAIVHAASLAPQFNPASQVASLLFLEAALASLGPKRSFDRPDLTLRC
jgi:hypothetical protein